MTLISWIAENWRVLVVIVSLCVIVLWLSRAITGGGGNG